MIYRLKKPIVGTDRYGSQAISWLPQSKSEWVPARATSIGAEKSVLALKISFGSLHPVSPASRIPESPRRRDFPSPTVLNDRAHDRQTHSHSFRFGREESVKEPVA